ncbi:GNAT family N-acetyltransferase [Streptococcus chenjunshii]|uniref:GNAT family N-acetyltransferase n=1 Tax=Streptococcus chenjunshii TaxID=2173853 RepID=A0A372KM11_9STRE|nr:GNAT family N-acetyltransferase [Streptococcus chenjunshii]AXQ79703.1 GNAT family N-acetyltransferase [Streptococcus chenjunshii]RFU51222.1 GNAT family N-acetyltransferase [Streptococcus chenjunshii]RFU53320.1 GNAT family N-acetyltransferase [Streptococcus chenjunshii]
MLIREGKEEDWVTVSGIEQANFPPEEAADSQTIKERLSCISDTFLIAEIAGEVVGYIEGPVISQRYLTDDLFHTVAPNPPQGGFIAVTSLSVAPAHQGQGVGTALLAALKDLSLAQKRQGITLTCHDYLISYYEMNGFTDEGESVSQHGGSVWYNLVWENLQDDM